MHYLMFSCKVAELDIEGISLATQVELTHPTWNVYNNQQHLENNLQFLLNV